MISYLHEKFGKERVLINMYEELNNSPQKVADKVCDFLGVHRAPIKSEKLNPSLGKCGMSFKRLLNNFLSHDCGTTNYGFSRNLRDSHPGKWQRFRHKFVYRFWGEEHSLKLNSNCLLLAPKWKK